MKTFTTRDDLVQFIEDATEPLYVRWSHGPEADAANGWISLNYACIDEESGEQVICDPIPEIGLSAVLVWDASNVTEMRYTSFGQVCYLLTGREVGECNDGYPLIAGVTPVAFVAESAM